MKFGLTGGLNTIIDFAAFTLLSSVFSVNVYAAQTAGYACGTLNSYLVNRSWTFSSKSRFFCVELVRFLVVNLFTFGVSYASLYFLQMWFPEASKIVLKLPVVCITIGINFMLSRLWVFREK